VILRERDIHAVASERIDGGTGLLPMSSQRAPADTVGPGPPVSPSSHRGAVGEVRFDAAASW